MKAYYGRGFLTALIASFIFSISNAEIPSGYYDKASGLTTSRLKTALYEIISPHKQVSSYSALPSYFERTDVYPDSKRWWDMYSDIPLYAPSFAGLNREHSFPKSWWGGSKTIPVYVDLFHLYPSEAAANQAKSNYPLGIVTGTPTFDNGISKVGKGIESGGAGRVYEPADEYKGDFARTYFYVVTAYQNLKWKYDYMAADGAYPTMQPWAIEMLLEWHRADPVSEKELRRNETVYSIQSNRNPFIDYPELAEYIWGNKMGQTFVPGETPEPGGDPELTSPAADATIDFGRVAIGHPSVRPVFFKGNNLIGMLEMSIIGEGKDAFTLEQNTLDASAANAPSGVYLNVTYSPEETGSHEARLVIQDGGLAGSISVTLRGEGAEEPSLIAPEALAADVLDGGKSYIANWNQPEGGDPVDYWTVYVTSYYADGKSTTESYLAEDTSLEIEADELSTYESYYVTAWALGCESAPSNSITVDLTNTIDLPGADSQPLKAIVSGLTITVKCGEPQRYLRIIDTMGRTVFTAPTVTSGDEFELPAPGIYFIVTEGHRTPVRIVAR